MGSRLAAAILAIFLALPVAQAAGPAPGIRDDAAPAVEQAARTDKKVLIGPRGGRYYINRNGKKTYCGRKNPRC